MSPTGDDLAGRLREALAGRDVREVRMFGGLSFMVDGRMVAAARRGGELLLRVDPTHSAQLLALPGARQAVMGTGRDMGPGWLQVSPEVLAGDGLGAWLGHALACHAAQVD